jgi:acetoin utilization protein AcuB
MVISDVMTRSPFYIEILERVKTAKQIIINNGIKHLPVVDDQIQIVGIITDRDIKLHQAVSDDPDFHQNAMVSDFCIKHPYTVGPDTPLLEVIEHMLAEHIGSTLVAEEDRLTGIFTKTDACRVLVDFLRVGKIKGI